MYATNRNPIRLIMISSDQAGRDAWLYSTLCCYRVWRLASSHGRASHPLRGFIVPAGPGSVPLPPCSIPALHGMAGMASKKRWWCAWLLWCYDEPYFLPDSTCAAPSPALGFGQDSGIQVSPDAWSDVRVSAFSVLIGQSKKKTR